MPEALSRQQVAAEAVTRLAKELPFNTTQEEGTFRQAVVGSQSLEEGHFTLDLKKLKGERGQVFQRILAEVIKERGAKSAATLQAAFGLNSPTNEILTPLIKEAKKEIDNLKAAVTAMSAKDAIPVAKAEAYQQYSDALQKISELRATFKQLLPFTIAGSPQERGLKDTSQLLDKQLNEKPKAIQAYEKEFNTKLRKDLEAAMNLVGPAIDKKTKSEVLKAFDEAAKSSAVDQGSFEKMLEPLGGQQAVVKQLMDLERGKNIAGLGENVVKFRQDTVKAFAAALGKLPTVGAFKSKPKTDDILAKFKQELVIGKGFAETEKLIAERAPKADKTDLNNIIKEASPKNAEEIAPAKVDAEKLAEAEAAKVAAAEAAKRGRPPVPASPSVEKEIDKKQDHKISTQPANQEGLAEKLKEIYGTAPALTKDKDTTIYNITDAAGKKTTIACGKEGTLITPPQPPSLDDLKNSMAAVEAMGLSSVDISRLPPDEQARAHVAAALHPTPMTCTGGGAKNLEAILKECKDGKVSAEDTSKVMEKLGLSTQYEELMKRRSSSAALGAPAAPETPAAAASETPASAAPATSSGTAHDSGPKLV